MTELLNNRNISPNQTPEVQNQAPEVIGAVEAPLYKGYPIPFDEDEMVDLYTNYQERRKESKGEITPEQYVDDSVPIYTPEHQKDGTISQDSVDRFEESKRAHEFAVGMTRLSPDRFALARGYMFPKSNEQRQMTYSYGMNKMTGSDESISVADYIDHANASSPDGQFAAWLNSEYLLNSKGSNASKIRKVTDYYNQYIDTFKTTDDAANVAPIHDDEPERKVNLADFDSYRSLLAQDPEHDEQIRQRFMNQDTQPMAAVRANDDAETPGNSADIPLFGGNNGDPAEFNLNAPLNSHFQTVSYPQDNLEVSNSQDAETPVLDVEQQEALDAAREALDASREEFAALSAKYQGSVLKRRSTRRKYIAAEKNYYDELENSNSLMVDHLLAENPEASVAEVFEKTLRNTLDDEIALRERSVELLNNTRVGKVINWIAAPGKSRLTRFMRGAAVSAGVGLVVGALTVSTGGAAVAVGASIGARGGVAAFKAFAKRSGENGRGINTELDQEAIMSDMKDLAASGKNKYNLEGQASAETSKRLAKLALGNRKHAMYIDVDSAIESNRQAAAAGVVGGLAGAVGGRLAGDFIGDHAGSVAEWTKDRVSGALGRIAGLGDIFSNDNTQVFETTPERVPEINEMPTPIELPKPSFSDLASNIELGEGMNQTIAETLNRNDIPGYVLNDIVRELGPKFETMDLTYAMGDGSYGWRRSGALSSEALTMIQQAAEARGYSVVR